MSDLISIDYGDGISGKSKPLTYEKQTQTTDSNTPFTKTVSKKPRYVLNNIGFGNVTTLRALVIYDVEYDNCVLIMSDAIYPNSNYIQKISDTEWKFNAGGSYSNTHLITFAYEE